MDNQLQGVEKVLNSLGKKLAKQLYGLDLNFKVTGVLENNPYYGPKYMVLAITDEEIPNVLKVRNHEWGYGRYSTLINLQENLQRLFKYVGLQDLGLLLNTEQTRVWDLLDPDEEDYINNPNKFTTLVDGTYVLDNETGWIYTLYNDNRVDVDNGNHITDIDVQEWWDDLTKQDKLKLDRLYK